MKAKKILYWFVGVLGVILLGAIANGVWSEILSPALSWTADTVIRFLSSISLTYKNKIYLEAVKGFHEAPSINVLFLIYGVVIGASLYFVVFLAYRKYKNLTSKEQPTSPVELKSKYISTCFYILVVLCFILWDFIKLSTVNRIVTQSFNSIDIVAPFIEEKEYLSLKSSFLRIKNADDYERINRDGPQWHCHA